MPIATGFARVAVALPPLLMACQRAPSSGQALPEPVAVVAAPALPCPIVPVSLVMTPAAGEPRTVLSLDARGRLDISLFTEKRDAATLDPQGCLASDNELWAEWAPNGKVWTPHQTLDVAGSCLAMNKERSLCIAPDGKVEIHAKNEPSSSEFGSMAISGYREGARCVSMLLLATFTSMMPSMAVVDGKPARAPAPEGSRCGAFRRP